MASTAHTTLYPERNRSFNTVEGGDGPEGEEVQSATAAWDGSQFRVGNLCTSTGLCFTRDLLPAHSVTLGPTQDYRGGRVAANEPNGALTGGVDDGSAAAAAAAGEAA